LSRQRNDPSFDPTPEGPIGLTGEPRPRAEALALVLAWSRTEPHRAGECVLLQEDPVLIGRGGPRSDDPHPRVALSQVRPGFTTACPSPHGPNLSRRHALITPEGDRLRIERLGKGALAVDGDPRDHFTLEAGQTLLMADELLFVCERRLSALPVPPLAQSTDFPFGAPDRFGLTGETAATWRLRDQLRFVAGSGSPLLVTGPPGVGKELVARAVHKASAARERPFLMVGGATLTRAELDALTARTDAPFVVIDEVSEVPLEVQSFLARYIAHTLSLPLPRPRLVATMASQQSGARSTSLRPDLGSRFVMTLHVPGLDERVADIPLLARALLLEIAAEQPEIAQRFFSTPTERSPLGEPHLTACLIDRLVRHRWTAHTRELLAVLWAAMTSATRAEIDATPEVQRQLTALDESFSDPLALDADTVRQALEASHGKVVVAARALGLKNRWVLYRLMERLDIRP
jgi:hypothetical protein